MKRLGLLATLMAGAALAGCGGGSDSDTTALNAGALSALGQACTAASQCTSGFCATGVCCSSACTSGCGACNLAGKVGTCSPVTGGTVCRAAAGECDVAETCSGSSTACPADAKKGNAMACTDDGNPCTTDLCNGSSATCQHAAGNNGTACPDDGNPCTTDRCNGTSTVCQHAAGNNGTACPDDGNLCTTDRCNGTSTVCQHAAGNNGTACPDDGNPCTTDRCNGTSTTCQHAPGNTGVTCRAAAGACDVAETCTGTSATCPTDGFLPSTTVCRAANGVCDAAESCTGTSAACPADGFKPSTVVCRTANGVCDAAESCTGTSAACPADGFLPSTVVCRAANGVCDAAESCTGIGAACPADGFKPSTVVCRAANGVCDAAESCTGMSTACPADGFLPSTTVCRAANGACDAAESCTGMSTACPADGFKASTTVCRAANGACDAAESCTGTSAACPADGFLASTTVCRAANGTCDAAESCTGTSAACPADGFKPSTTVCRAANGTCDVAESCTGTSAACPADGFLPSTTICRTANGACDAAESCTGTSAACPADGFKPSTTVCRPVADVCDVAENCPGTGPACPADGFKPSTATCRLAVDVCDATETCTGTGAACPTDGFKPSTTVCRAANGACDVAESCTGTSAACPTDALKPNGAACSDGNTCTQNDVCQSGACVGSNPTVCSQCPQTMTAWLSSPGLVAHWAFDNQAASITDSSGNNHTGVASITTGGGYDQAHPPLANDVGSFRFGGSDYVSVPDSPALQIAGNLTVSAWVRVTASAAEYNVVSKDTAGTAFSNYNLGIIDNQPYFGIGFRAGSQEGGSQVASPASQVGGQASCDTGGCMVLAHAGFVDSTHPLGTWRLLTGVYDDSAKSIAVYLDCDTTASGTFATSGVPFTNTEALQIGRRKWNAASGLVGNVDSVAIWNRALSPVEVSSHTQCLAWTCASSSGTCVSAAAADGALCDDGNACSQGDACAAGSCQGATAFACTPPDTCHGAGTCNAGAAAPQPPSTQDLIGWWKLDGDGKDASGGGHDLKNEGAVPAPGRFGLGMKFDGASCMTAVPWTEARMQGASGVTMMAWVNPSDGYVCPHDPTAVMGKGTDYSAATHCWWGNDPPDPYVTGSANGLGYPGGFGSATHNKWTLMAITWDHQTLTIFVNGKDVISYDLFSNPGDLPDAGPLFAIGCQVLSYFPPGGRGSYFIGTIDEAMLYRRALAPAEIAAYYAAADPCTHPVLADGTSCNDASVCTQTDSCQAGTCVGTNPVTCAAQDQCHTAGTCSPTTGCSNPAVADGTACSDGNPCTRTDSCQAGACVAGNPVQCVASDSCHAAGSCDPGTGVCTNPPLPGGTCDVGAFDYDKAGRLIHDRGAVLTYDAYDQLRTVEPAPTAPPPQLQGVRIEKIGDIGGTNTSPRAMNRQGQIAGYTLIGNVGHAFLQPPNEPPVDINAAAGVTTTMYGLGINDAGTVAGNLYDAAGAEHVFLYNQASGLQDLGVNNPTVNVSYINNENQITGTFNLPSSGSHAALYSPGIGWQDLGTLPGGTNSFAFTVDDLGNVLGSSTVPGSPTTGFDLFGHAFFFNHDVGMVDLNSYTDPTLGSTLVTANRFSGDWVVGVANVGGRDHGYRLKLSTGTVEPITATAWDGDSYAYGINSYGEVVGDGFLDAGNTQKAAWFFSDTYGFVNLNQLVDPALGWDLQFAWGINDAGDVIGWGYLNGVWSAYVLHLPLRTSTGGTPTVAEVHSYGYDGLRTSTTTSPGMPGASVQRWFTQDYTERNGVREHYLRVGDRLVARLTAQPNAGVGMGTVRNEEPTAKAGSDGSGVAAGLALLLAAFVSAMLGVAQRRRRWVTGLAGLASLLLVGGSCEVLSHGTHALDWHMAPSLTHYFHQGISPGPSLITDSTGAKVEERRYEPFGQPIPTVDVASEPQNILGKLTDPNTGWSYHGARWMQPQTARWTAPDPAIKGPDPKQLNTPWNLNPYAYVSQRPTQMWDPDGAENLPALGERLDRVARWYIGEHGREPSVVELMETSQEWERLNIYEPLDKSLDHFTMSDGFARGLEWCEKQYMIHVGLGWGVSAVAWTAKISAGAYTAFKYMHEAGVPLKNIRLFMRGMALWEPAAIRTLYPGEKLVQYVGSKGVGSWFGRPGTPLANLGISGARQLRTFVVTGDKPIQVLETTAKSVLDDFSTDGVKVWATGGGTQLFVSRQAAKSIVEAP